MGRIMEDVFYYYDNSMYVNINKNLVTWLGYRGSPSRQRQKMFRLMDKLHINCVLLTLDEIRAMGIDVYTVISAGLSSPDVFSLGDNLTPDFPTILLMTLKDFKTLTLNLPTDRGKQARGFVEYIDKLARAHLNEINLMMPHVLNYTGPRNSTEHLAASPFGIC